MSAISKTGRGCIFCGGSGLTKEHIWPKWIRRNVPRSGITLNKHTITTGYKDGFPIVSPGMQRRPGDLLDQTRRCVCKKCNNGWMSRIEGEAHELLSLFVANHMFWPFESSENRTTVARWAILRSKILEDLYPAKDRPSDKYTSDRIKECIEKRNREYYLGNYRNIRVFASLQLTQRFGLGGFNHLTKSIIDPRTWTLFENNLIVFSMRTLTLMVVTGVQISSHVDSIENTLNYFGFYEIFPNYSGAKVILVTSERELENATDAAFFHNTGPRRKAWEVLA